MAQPTTPETSDGAVDLFYDPINQPLRGASLFYALYYLDEIENVTEAEFDRVRITSEYHDAFFWYGVFSVAKELIHADSGLMLTIGGHNNSIDGWARLNETDDAIESVFGDREMEEEIHIILGTVQTLEEYTRVRDRDVIADFLDEWDFTINLFDEPFRFLMAARDIFDVAAVSGVHDGETEQTGTWLGRAYGGPAWARICDHLLRANQITETIFVDTSWGVQHNNSGWLDKIFIDAGESNIATEVFGPLMGDNVGATLTGVRQVLNYNALGEMRPVFDVAVHYDNEVAVPLRQWRQTFEPVPTGPEHHPDPDRI